MAKLPTRVCLALLLTALSVPAARLEIGPDAGTAGRIATLKVDALEADDMGRYEIDLRFDASVLDVVGVHAGPSIKRDLLDWSDDGPGQLWVGGPVTDPQAEHRPLLKIRVRILGEPGALTHLDLGESRAWEPAGGSALELKVTPASLSVRRPFLPFGLSPLQVLVGLVIVGPIAGIVVFLRIRKVQRPAWAVAPPPVADAPPEASTVAAPPVAVPPVAIPDPPVVDKNDDPVQ